MAAAAQDKAKQYRRDRAAKVPIVNSSPRLPDLAHYGIMTPLDWTSPALASPATGDPNWHRSIVTLR